MKNVLLTEQPMTTRKPILSLFQLLDPAVLANPYPLYERLRTEAQVHWDPYLHAWVVTRYADVITVLHHFSANRTPTPEQFAAIGLAELGPLAQVMVKQMLFMDAPDSTQACGMSPSLPAGHPDSDAGSPSLRTPEACRD